MLQYFKENPWQILLIANYVIAISAAVSVILSNLNPTKTFSYLIILVAFPFLGIVIYYLFGQQYRKNKIFKRKNIFNQDKILEWKKRFQFKEEILKELEDEIVDDKIKLIKLLCGNNESPLTIYNKVDLIINGDEKFERLIEDIKKARKTIHLEYYIVKDDIIGNKILDLLCDKAHEGVKVRLITDDVGSSISFRKQREIREKGIEFNPFMPVLFHKFTSKLNYRNHRKIAVIDGEIGYVGGINISDNYVNQDRDFFWRDTHLRIEGEAVSSLQLQFLLNWDFVTSEKIIVEDHFFPQCNIKNKTPIQIVASGPDSDWAYIMEAIFTAVNTADKSICITTPYFIPSEEIIFSIVSIARSGVEVKLIIPKESDSWVSKYATLSFVEQVLEAGVRVFLYKKGFVHAKTMVVDGVFTTIGTSNMDYRSFRTNFEINALIYDSEFSQKTLQSFNEDLKECEELNYKDWLKRKPVQKMQESFCRLWAPLL